MIATNTPAYRMYISMVTVFLNHVNDTLYDVDMFTGDIRKICFPATDPQSIDEDDFMWYQEALIMLIRDDLLFEHFGVEGLAIVHAELMYCGEQYFVNKVIFKEEEAC